jgi:hypothetical protein
LGTAKAVSEAFSVLGIVMVRSGEVRVVCLAVPKFFAIASAGAKIYSTCFWNSFSTLCCLILILSIICNSSRMSLISLDRAPSGLTSSKDLAWSSTSSTIILSLYVFDSWPVISQKWL